MNGLPPRCCCLPPGECNFLGAEGTSSTSLSVFLSPKGRRSYRWVGQFVCRVGVGGLIWSFCLPCCPEAFLRGEHECTAYSALRVCALCIGGGGGKDAAAVKCLFVLVSILAVAKRCWRLMHISTPFPPPKRETVSLPSPVMFPPLPPETNIERIFFSFLVSPWGARGNKKRFLLRTLFGFFWYKKQKSEKKLGGNECPETSILN